jgi:hypothetical protein
MCCVGLNVWATQGDGGIQEMGRKIGKLFYKPATDIVVVGQLILIITKKLTATETLMPTAMAF